jgi:hypothetical protein
VSRKPRRGRRWGSRAEPFRSERSRRMRGTDVACLARSVSCAAAGRASVRAIMRRRRKLRRHALDDLLPVRSTSNTRPIPSRKTGLKSWQRPDKAGGPTGLLSFDSRLVRVTGWTRRRAGARSLSPAAIRAGAANGSPTQADDLPEPQIEGLKPVRSQWRNPTAEADSLDLGRPSWVSCWRDGAFARYANARRRLPFYPFVSPCNSVMEPSASSTLKSTPVPSKVRMTSRASSFPSV